MLGSMIKFFSPPRLGLEVPLAVFLATSVLMSEAKLGFTQELGISATSPVAQVKVFGKDTLSAPKGKLPEKDGIYLYGQSPKPQQIGQEYMVFEMRGGKVTGAFYLPHSEFSCFSGTLHSGNLALMVANGPDSNAYEDSVAAQNSQRVATASNTQIEIDYNQSAYPYSVALQNYHQIAAVSSNDQQLLKTCKNSYQ